jgi:hypothetical protein
MRSIHDPSLRTNRPKSFGSNESSSDTLTSPICPENIENNEHTELLGRNLNDRTPSWQRDEPYIRVPARLAKWILDNPFYVLCWILVIGMGIPLFIAISGHHKFWVGLLVGIYITMMLWAIVSRLSQERF